MMSLERLKLLFPILLICFGLVIGTGCSDDESASTENSGNTGNDAGGDTIDDDAGATDDTGGSTTECDTSQTLCDGECVDLNSNSEHCGGCDEECAFDGGCDDGICRCPTGLVNCGDRCADLRWDEDKGRWSLDEASRGS